MTISNCGTTAQCSPIQTLTGADHKTYKVETFIRLLANPSISTRLEKVVTVIIRKVTVSGTSKVLTMQTAFDTGPPNTSPPMVPNCAQIGVKCESELIDPMVIDNNTLQIVYTDDGQPRGAGYAPTAFLNGVQQLGLGISDTDGWPLNYVTNWGGSASSKYQRLFTIALPSGLPAGCYTVLVTTSDFDGPDTDQWAWPINIAADGTVTTVSNC